MDMELLARMVGELVPDNDRVGLPGLGTFVSEIVPATFSDRGYTINPPYRRLSFVSEVLEEELLADFYSVENAVDKPAAKAYLTAYLAQLGDILRERKTVTFPGLGRLRATKQNHFFFVPSEELDIFPEGFGLNPVSLKTHVETDEEVSIAVSDLASFMKPAGEAAPAPEPESPRVQSPEPEPEPVPVPVPSPVAAPVSGPATVSVKTPAAVLQKPRARRLWVWPVAVFFFLVLLLAAFMLLAHLAPDFVDRILYTEEELRIINA